MDRKEFFEDTEAEVTTVIPTKTKVLRYIMAAILIVYIISPIDLFPEFAGIAGFFDDIFAIFVLYKIFKDTYADDKVVFKKMAVFFAIYTVLIVVLTIYIFSIYVLGK